MRFEFKPSFVRSLNHLHPSEKSRVKQTAERLVVFFETGKATAGLGVKHLRQKFWEARSGLRVRLLFRWDKDLIEFILAGSHDDMHRFLKRESSP